MSKKKHIYPNLPTVMDHTKSASKPVAVTNDYTAMDQMPPMPPSKELPLPRNLLQMMSGM